VRAYFVYFTLIIIIIIINIIIFNSDTTVAQSISAEIQAEKK